MHDEIATPIRGRLHNAQEIAAARGIPLWRVYELAREQGMPHIRLGRSLRFDPAAVDDWLKAGGTGPWRPEDR